MKPLLFLVQWTLVGLGVAFAALLAWPGVGLQAVLGEVENRPSPTTGGYAAAVRKAAPAVVSIQAETQLANTSNALTRDPLFQNFFGTGTPSALRESSLGSGVILDTDGVVLTNYHVIESARTIRVTLQDGRSSVAQTIGTDPETDLAVLRIALGALPVIPLGSSDRLEVGEVVLAIGNPFGIGQTVTQGIVSATGRNRVGINTFENFIQTDAAINFGNSGGALVDVHGNLVGINAVRATSAGIGFAIPTNIALAIAREILASGSVERGWLGIDARDLSNNLRDTLGANHGIVVLGVLADGPAARAGIRPGDVLDAIGAQPIADSRGAIETIAGLKPGTTVLVSGLRTRQPFAVKVEVSRRPHLP